MCPNYRQEHYYTTLYGALILFMTLSTACGLRCYTCTATDPHSCTDTKSCPVIFNRCFSLRIDGYNMVTKGCQTSIACVGAMACCEGNLCNSAIPTGPSVILLLVSSAIITLFL
ncbi:lymphocyte antigen 6G-like isoform X1 [Epinephelus fuscoguttatus]|uniref:lymphocyte antigen 6G-like isoform X1 n=1 Tax=Epinephelus fuscoguttatus TaxID=293821 RepID=UPI0020D02BE4|nr:lymphocyte antigen 6G-like isoform X1 [Epinephelus fuscoguttatus]